MHHTLRHRKDQLRRQAHSDGSTLYLNAARVPRWRQHHGQTQRHFALVTLQSNQVIRACQVWVDDQQGLVEAIEVQAMDSREPLELPLAISSQPTLR
jgi:uncharacterized protein (TIGR04168 family)